MRRIHTHLLVLLSHVEFAEKLKSCQFTDIQSFYKAVQVSAKGARTELESRLLEYKDKHDARLDESVSISTPERRDGRKRRWRRAIGLAFAGASASARSNAIMGKRPQESMRQRS